MRFAYSWLDLQANFHLEIFRVKIKICETANNDLSLFHFYYILILNLDQSD